MRIFRFRTRREDRGAVLPEYALIIALVVVGSIGAIQAAQRGGTSRLAASPARISANDGAYYAGAVATTVPPPSTTSTTAAPIGVHLAANPTVTVADAGGNRWQVTITLTLLDSSNNGVIGATVDGTWSDGGGGSSPVSTCTTSTSAGQCTMQFTRIRDATPSVTYTLSTITGGSFSWTPVAGGEGTVVISCGTFC